MRKQTVRLMLCIAVSAVIGCSLTGCGQRPEGTSTEKQTEKKTERQTERAERITEVERESETESETQKLITSVDYTSKDGTVKITLPDNTWKVTQDADEMRVFQSGSAAIINIVHASTPTAMNALSIMSTEQELKDSLTRQYASENAYSIEEFNLAQVKGVSICRYTVKFNAQARMWAYSVTNAIAASDQAYVVTGTVTDDNKTLLEAVRKAVESFRVLKDETLKDVTGEVLSGKTQKTTEKVDTATASAQELTSLTDYGTTVVLVTTDTVNVRSQPGTDSDILIMLNGDAQVNVVGETANWFKVNILGNIGYIRKDFLVYGKTGAEQPDTGQSEQQQNSGSDQSAAELGTATNYQSPVTLYVSASSDVNLRSQPGMDAGVINTLPAGTSVTVTGETDNWFIVSVGGSTAYVSKAYLTSDSSGANSSSGGQNTNSNTGGDSGNSNSGNNDGSTNSGGGSTALTSVSGTVVSATVDSITVQGDDGKTYNIYYGDANTSTNDGLYTGVYVNVALDSSQAASDGTLYATNVKGY